MKLSPVIERLQNGTASTSDVSIALGDRRTSTKLWAFDLITESMFFTLKDQVGSCVFDRNDLVASEALCCFSDFDAVSGYHLAKNLPKRMSRFTQAEYFHLMAKFPTEESRAEIELCWKASPKTPWRKIGFLTTQGICAHDKTWIQRLVDLFRTSSDDHVKSSILNTFDLHLVGEDRTAAGNAIEPCIAGSTFFVKDALGRLRTVSPPA